MPEELSKGGQMVRVGFNPSEHESVSFIKGKIAELIDHIENWKSAEPRLAAIAQSKLEEAAMFATKLLTTKPMPEEEKLPETVPSTDPLPTQETPEVDPTTPAPTETGPVGPEDPSTGNPADNPE